MPVGWRGEAITITKDKEDGDNRDNCSGFQMSRIQREQVHELQGLRDCLQSLVRISAGDI